MLFRVVLESLSRRRRRKLLSLVAITLGIGVTAVVGTIALDVGDKVSRELRSFGANISVTPAADSLSVAVGGVDFRPAGVGSYLPESQLVKLKRIFWRNNIVAFAPFLYVPVQVKGHTAVLIGSWFDQPLRVDKSDVFVTGLRRLHPAWKVAGHWPADSDLSGALVGRSLAEHLHLEVGQSFSIKRSDFRGQAQLLASDRSRAENLPQPLSTQAELIVRGILTTGGPEDGQIFAPLALVQRWAGLEGKVRRVEISALTKPEDTFARSDTTRLTPKEFDRWYCSPYVRSIAYQIQQAIPGAEARPVYQVAETEGKILDRVGALMAVLVGAALATAALAVASSMLATVLESRAEIGLFKSLGATNARVATVFVLEACMVGLAGGAAGYFVGSLLAWRLAHAIFGVQIGLHWVLLPVCLALAVVVTLAGGAVPLSRVLRISPATVLREG